MSNPPDNPAEFRRRQQRRRNVRIIPSRTSHEKCDVDTCNERHDLADHRLVAELNGARYQSEDLVDDVFGHFIPASLVGVVLAGLLEQKLVKVTYVSGRLVPEQHHHSAIAWAVCHAERAGCLPDSSVPAVEPKSREHNFIRTWTLPNNPNRRTETKAAQFMNSVAELAFKEIHKQTPTALGRRWIQWCFGRPPYADHPYTMSDQNVEQRLGNHVLPTTAWSVLGRQKEEVEEETVLDSEPGHYLSDHLELTYPADSVAEEERDQDPLDRTIISDLQTAYRATSDPSLVPVAEAAWRKYEESIPKGEPQDLDEGYANWTRTRVVVELKSSNLDDAIQQTHLHLRALHRAQPWLAAAHGIAMTENRLCLIRSDSAGCEECSFKLSTGRGNVDTIRIALGTVTAEDHEFGHNPSFTYKYQSRSVESHRTQGNKKQTITVEYHCHVVDTVKVDHSVFTVQEAISNTASIRGRGTTVFKVRRDGDQTKHWALKRTWVDVLGECQENALMELAREKNVEYVLLPEPGDCWTCLDTDSMRSSASASQPRDLKTRGVFAEVELRQETYCLLPYKLPLHHFRDAKDFVSGVICILKGLDSLYTKARILHGDVSFDNFLFDEDEGIPRRAWLIDLDNACIKKPNRAKKHVDLLAACLDFDHEPYPLERRVIRGTGPFMALDVMNGHPREHVSDVESVFYLLFLFFFTFGEAGTDPFLDPQTDPFLNKNRLHPSIKRRTTGSLVDMSEAKLGFFMYPRAVLSEVVRKHTRPEWQEEGRTKAYIEDLITSAYAVVWELVEKKPHVYILGNATAQDLIKCLEAWLEAPGANARSSLHETTSVAGEILNCD
ncbi:hypothetical protein DFH06DRAFT_1477470 [Mycena polygramma]|nr:hypothetical protein DFH06DRAFT_1477470 [Mycena polygramma]